MIAYYLGCNNSSPSTSVTNYQPIEGGDGSMTALTSEIFASQVIPHAQTMDGLHVMTQNAPGAGKSWAFTVMVNGVASALTCTISDTNVFASDPVHSLSLAAGDTVSLRIVPSGTPTATGMVSWNTRQSATGKFAVLAGSTSTASATTFTNPQGSQGNNSTETSVLAPSPVAGVISNLYVKLDVAPGGSGANSFTLTLRQNVASSTLTTTVTDPATTNHDTTHSVTIVAGDRLAIGVTVGGTPTAARISASYTFTPTTDGDACWMHANNNAPSTSATNYDPVIGGSGTTWNTTETSHDQAGPQVTMKDLFVRGDAGPGTGGKQITCTVRKAAADTALTVVMTGAGAASFSITGQTVNVALNGLLAIASVPALTPFTTRVATGIRYVDNPSPAAGFVPKILGSFVM